MRTRSLTLLGLLSLAMTAAACAPSDEDTESAEGQISAKKLKPFLADAKKLKLDDFTRIGVGIATDQLSNALSSGNNGVVIDPPEVFAAAAEPNKVIPKVSQIKALDAIVSGLGARFGEKELGTEVNAIRLRHLQSGADKYYIESGFTAMARARAGALIVAADELFYGQRAELAKLAIKHRLPAISPNREQAEAGGLMSYGQSLAQHYQRAALYVDKIIKGAKAGDLPVEQPTLLELVVNQKTAGALGVKIPNSILLRADKVIE